MIQIICKSKSSYKTIQLPSLPPIPTMITDDEKQYLYWLGRDVVSGSGAIVEIGTWFGCSAGYLGAGLRDANKEIPFYCFDRFELQGIEKRKARQQGFDHVEKLDQNSDIMPLTAEHLRTIYPIHLYKTYIDKISFPPLTLPVRRSLGEVGSDSRQRIVSKGIELLHLDAPKRESDILHVLKTFVPYLMPGKSIIVLQDFGMPRAYALPLIFGQLSEYFEFIDIPSQESTMAVFVYRKELPIGELEHIDINSWPPAYAQKIWQKMAANYINPHQRAFFNFGLALYFFRKGEKELAVKIAKENAPYVSSEQAELLDKRLCSRLWKLAFK